MKKALISGITGQDGSYLAEFLLQKGYEVHGILRRSSSFNTGRIEHLYFDEWVRDMKQKRTINLHYGDMTDSSSLIRIIQQQSPAGKPAGLFARVRSSDRTPVMRPVRAVDDRKTPLRHNRAAGVLLLESSEEKSGRLRRRPQESDSEASFGGSFKERQALG